MWLTKRQNLDHIITLQQTCKNIRRPRQLPPKCAVQLRLSCHYQHDPTLSPNSLNRKEAPPRKPQNKNKNKTRNETAKAQYTNPWFEQTSPPHRTPWTEPNGGLPEQGTHPPKQVQEQNLESWEPNPQPQLPPLKEVSPSNHPRREKHPPEQYQYPKWYNLKPKGPGRIKNNTTY